MALKCYCGLDEVLWMSKESRNFRNILSKVIDVYKSQVILAKTLIDSKGETIGDLIYNAFVNDPESKIKMQKTFDNSMRLRYELYDYLQKNKIIGAVQSIAFNKATRSLETQLAKIVDSAFSDEVIASRKQIIESTV
jgi:hypothetical protein